jgi:Pin2-interacting protein X1
MPPICFTSLLPFSTSPISVGSLCRPSLNLYTDNSRFGQQYLAKFGWTPDSGSGLGANGDGRLAHISVAQKLNLLGIGNGHSGGANNPDAVAWKQSKDFEGVLKRLNGSEAEEEVKIEQALLHGFVRGEVTESTIGNAPTHEEVLDGKAEKRRRREEKRQRKQEQSKGETDKDALQASTSKQPSPELPQFAATPTSQPKPSSMGPRMACVLMTLPLARPH